MISSKCPVRISLAGGSTDLEPFIDTHGRGSVINFPISVYSYIFLHKDSLGGTGIKKKYTISYSVREETNNVVEIKNDIVREALSYFDLDPSWITLTSDVFAVGSGLALSSSYMNSLIKAICIDKNLNFSNYKISKLAMDLERKFNPLLGYQDTYGCGIGGLKRIDIGKNKNASIKHIETDIFDMFDMYLLYTGVSRSSTTVLKSVSVKDDSLLHIVDDMEVCLVNSDFDGFVQTIIKGWELKKKTSPMIIENERVKKLDTYLSNDKDVLCHRLCGAGNGGFYLAFTKKNTNIKNFHPDYYAKRVYIDQSGVVGVKI